MNEYSLPASKVGLIFLKIHPLRCFQIDQQAKITILEKQGPLTCLLAIIKASGVIQDAMVLFADSSKPALLHFL
jgi:hypothetical protein